MQGIIASVRAVIWSRQVAMPPGLLRHSAWRDPKFDGGGALDEIQVGLVVRGVVNGLAAEHATVPDEVGQQAQPTLCPAQPCVDRARDSARYSNPVTCR